MKKEFTIARGLKINVTLHTEKYDAPALTGGPVKWSVQPMWSIKSRRIPQGQHLTMGSNAYEVAKARYSIIHYTEGWLAHLRGKSRKQIWKSGALTQFITELDDWLGGV